jgi:triacylglycerol lipase
MKNRSNIRPALAAFAMVAAGCAGAERPVAGPVDENTGAGGEQAPTGEQSPGGGPAARTEPACDPACGPMQVCNDGRCACAAGSHDGGDGACVFDFACSAGFAIAAGGDACLPLAQVCVPHEPCTEASGWSAGACGFAASKDGTSCEGHSEDRCVTRFACAAGACAGSRPACAERRPIVFVHGINGSSANFATLADRLVADGWPRESLYFFDAADPSWGCNVDNAEAIRKLVERARAETCAARVDVVAHSMGSLSSRQFMKNLGGHEVVNTYVTLGGMHHGLASPCWAPGFLPVCTWKELCESGDFIAQLNADPVIPQGGPWVSIFGTADTTVPNDSSRLEGAENIEISGVDHMGLLTDEATYAEVKRALGYACW